MKPTDGEDKVARSAVVEVTFSEGMAASSFTEASFELTANGVPVAGTVDVQGEQVTFSPEQPLYPFASHSLRIGAEVSDVAGTPLGEPFVTSFTTKDGAWGDPVEVADGSEGYVTKIKVLPGPDGAALAVWATQAAADSEEMTALWARSYSPEVGWGQPTQIDGKDGAITHYVPDAFAIDAEGGALVGWSQNDSMRIARYLPDANWLEPVDLQTDGDGTGSFAGVQFDDAGNAVAAWLKASGEIGVWAARCPPGGAWIGPENLESVDSAASELSLAVSAGGHAIAAWIQDSKIWANYYAGSWNGPKEIIPESPGTSIRQPRAAFISETQAILVWLFAPLDGNGLPILASNFSVESGWEKGARLPVPDGKLFQAWFPTIAANGFGRAISVWSDSTDSIMWGNVYEESKWQVAKQLASEQGELFLTLTLDPVGNGFGAWLEALTEDARLVVRRYTPAGWSQSEIFEPVKRDISTRPELGANRAVNGTTWVAWNDAGKGWASVFE